VSPTCHGPAAVFIAPDSPAFTTRNEARYWSKPPSFHTPPAFNAVVRGVPVGIMAWNLAQKKLVWWWKN